MRHVLTRLASLNIKKHCYTFQPAPHSGVKQTFMMLTARFYPQVFLFALRMARTKWEHCFSLEVCGAREPAALLLFHIRFWVLNSTHWKSIISLACVLNGRVSYLLNHTCTKCHPTNGVLVWVFMDFGGTCCDVVIYKMISCGDCIQRRLRIRATTWNISSTLRKVLHFLRLVILQFRSPRQY